MRKNIKDLKRRDPDDRRRTVLREGVRAFPVRHLTRQAIRSYFADWEKFGGRIKDNYKKVFRKFLRWWADEIALALGLGITIGILARCSAQFHKGRQPRFRRRHENG